MANNSKITIDIIVDDNGSLKLVANQANQAAKSINNLTTSTKRASGARGNYNKLEKGTAGLTSNSTKAFAKQAQTLGGTLVPAYATLAANIFALTALFGALQRAAGLQQLQDGLERVGASSGKNLKLIANDLREITGAAISTKSAMSAVALGTSAGFTAKQLRDLTKVAKGASLALGRDLEDALTRLVRGTAKLEPEILDELGIMVRLDDAVSKYATTLGKRESQLTQFERSQAFLNATITQGLEKFETIADAVDANPYDKLAATFADLQKTILNVINTVLEPLVRFLASSPTALLGVLTIFASTLFKKIVPGLEELQNQSIKLSKLAAIEAKQAAKITSDSYTKALNNVKTSFNTVPPSIDRIKTRLLAGELSVKEYEEAIRNLAKSEALREAALKNHSKANYAAKEQELNQVRALKIAVQELSVAEKTRYIANTKGNLAQARSVSGRVQAGALANIDASGPIKGFVEATKGAQKQVAIFSRAMVGFLGGAKLGFSVLTKSAVLFGRALLNLLPGIGNLLFFGSMLWPVFEKLFGLSEIDKKVKEISNSFTNFRDISIALGTTFEKNTSSARIFAATLKVQVGILDQLKDGFERMAEAQREGVSEELGELYRERVALLKQAQTEYGASRIYNETAKELERVNKEIDKLTGKAGALDLGAASQILDGFKSEFLAMDEDVQAALSGVMDVVAQAEKDLIKGKWTTNSGFLAWFNEATAKAKALDQALQGARDSAMSFDKEVNKLVNKRTTPYDDVLASAQSIGNQLRTAIASNSADAQDAFLEQAPKFKKILESYFEALYEADYGKALDMFEADLQKIVDTIATATSEAANFKGEFDALKSVGKSTPAIMEAALESEQKMLEAQGRIIDAQLLGAEKLGLNEQQILKLQRERAVITDKTTRANYKDTQLTLAKAEQEKRLLEYTQKIETTERQIIEHKLQQWALTNKMMNLLGNANVSATKNAELINKSFADRMNLIVREDTMRKRSIKVEYNLLRAKLAIEKITAENAAKSAGKTDDQIAKMVQEFDGYLDALNEGEGSALRAIEAQTATNVLQAVTNKLEADSAAIQEQRAQTIEKINKLEERATIWGHDYLATQYSIQANLEKQSQIRTDIANLAFDESARNAKQLELTLLVTEEMEKREELYQKEVALAQRLIDLEARRLNMAGASVAGGAKDVEAAKARLANAIRNEVGAQFSGPEARSDAAANTRAAELDLAEKTIALLELEAEKIEAIGGAWAGSLSQMNTSFERLKLLKDDDPISAWVGVARGAFQPMIEDMKSLGPEGEAYAALFSGMGNMVELWTVTVEQMEAETKPLAKAALALQAIGATIAQINAMMAASSDAKIARIEQEIEAEKKRDGKSAASLAKMSALEKKAEKEKRKAFERNKKMQIAQTIVNTASGIMQAFAQFGWMPGVIFAAIIAAMGAAQLAAIQSTSYDGGGSISSGGAKSVTVGERSNTVDLAKSNSPSGELAYARGESGTGSGMGDFVPAFTGRATGGNTAYMVGEQGPELFVPNRPGTIVPADDTARRSEGTPTNVSFSINAIDARGVEEVLMQQRGNIISMIREAANARGEFFLEGINEAELA